MTQIATPDEVHRFWFADADDDPQAAGARGAVWFGSSADFDKEVRERFEPTIAAAARGALDTWRDAARSCVALVIVLDQFPRNVYRHSARAFAYDSLAFDVTKHAVEAGYLAALSIPERAFLLMAYQHVENVALQREGLVLFGQVHAEAPAEWRSFTENTLKFAQRHVGIVERFGRFPYRNAVLGRSSTPAEREYLDSNPEAFGQG